MNRRVEVALLRLRLWWSTWFRACWRCEYSRHENCEWCKLQVDLVRRLKEKE